MDSNAKNKGHPGRRNSWNCWLDAALYVLQLPGSRCHTYGGIDSTELRSVESWWRHQIETFFRVTGLCEGNSPVTGEFPSQRPVTRSFDVFFDLRLNRRLSKPTRRRWFETLSRSLRRHSNVWMNLYSVSLISWRKSFHLEHIVWEISKLFKFQKSSQIFLSILLPLLLTWMNSSQQG